MPEFRARLCVWCYKKTGLGKKKEVAAISSNRKFLEPMPLRDDRNKIQVIVELQRKSLYKYFGDIALIFWVDDQNI